jgi:hypothetical protein
MTQKIDFITEKKSIRIIRKTRCILHPPINIRKKNEKASTVQCDDLSQLATTDGIGYYTNHHRITMATAPWEEQPSTAPLHVQPIRDVRGHMDGAGRRKQRLKPYQTPAGSASP